MIDAKPSSMSRDHRKLRVFHQADGLVVQVYRDTAEFPVNERYGLQAQLRRAAVSVATNIVEGSSRATQTEYRRFLEIAHGSARECTYLIGLSTRLGFMKSGELADSYDRVAAALLAICYSMRPTP
jgi:four helix bundle protein